MSIIFDKIHAVATGQRFAKEEPIKVDIKARDLPESHPSHGLMNEYIIDCTFGRKIVCSPEDLPEMLKNVIRDVEHGIYKDIYEMINRLERAVYSCDTVKIKMEIGAIVKEIFE